MLDLKFVAQHVDTVVPRLQSRGGTLDLGPFQALMQERRELYVALEALNQQRSAANEEMKRRAREDKSAVESLRGELRVLSQDDLV